MSVELKSQDSGASINNGGGRASERERREREAETGNSEKASLLLKTGRQWAKLPTKKSLSVTKEASSSCLLAKFDACNGIGGGQRVALIAIIGDAARSVSAKLSARIKRGSLGWLYEEKPNSENNFCVLREE